MWDNHVIRGRRTEAGRGGGVPNDLFLHPRKFHEDDDIIAANGLALFATEPGLLLREREETEAAPPASNDPLAAAVDPEFLPFLVRVRGSAIDAADLQFGFKTGPRSKSEEAALLEYLFFFHFTEELLYLVEFLPDGAPFSPPLEWVTAGDVCPFCAQHGVRPLIHNAILLCNANM